MKNRLLLFCLIFVASYVAAQNSKIAVAAGYAAKGYVKSQGTGYNISVGYSYQAKEKWQFRIQLIHSNTYNHRYDVSFSDDDIIDGATIMRYADFPEDNSIRELHPFFQRSVFYDDYPNSLYEFEATPEYAHDRAVFFIVDYSIIQKKKFAFQLGLGTGLGLCNRQERLFSFTNNLAIGFFRNPRNNELFQTLRYFYWGGYLDLQASYQIAEGIHLFSRGAYFSELPRAFNEGAWKSGTLNINIGVEFNF